MIEQSVQQAHFVTRSEQDAGSGVCLSACLQIVTYRINARTRDEYVLGACHDYRPGLVTTAKLVSCRTCIIGIPREEANRGSKRSGRGRSRLKVGRFGLQHTSVYVCCRVEIVLIEHRVLGRSPV